MAMVVALSGDSSDDEENEKAASGECVYAVIMPMENAQL